MFPRLATGPGPAPWSTLIPLAKLFSYPSPPLDSPSKLNCAHVFFRLKYGYIGPPTTAAAATAAATRTTTCLPHIKTITKPSPSFPAVIRGTHPARFASSSPSSNVIRLIRHSGGHTVPDRSSRRDGSLLPPACAGATAVKKCGGHENCKATSRCDSTATWARVIYHAINGFVFPSPLISPRRACTVACPNLDHLCSSTGPLSHCHDYILSINLHPSSSFHRRPIHVLSSPSLYKPFPF